MLDRESLAILRAKTAEEIAALEALYLECTHKLSVTPAFRVATLDYLVHNRAVLDYLAHGMLSFCSTPPGKLYFPLAKPGMKRERFLAQIDSKWLPGLRTGHPELFAYLDGLQWYASGNETLLGLTRLVNSNKHVRLSVMEVADCIAVVVENPGYSGVQVGDRGLRSLRIEEGGILRLEGPCGHHLGIRGPQTIDQSTSDLRDADPGIKVRRALWREFKFDECPHTTALGFLVHVRTEVERICDRVLSLVDVPDSGARIR
jgi:hypothetical protein